MALTEPKGEPDDKPASLTLRTKEALRDRIVNGPLKAGAKLPTEKALGTEFGVSRTVIREAVAALRSDGLLEAKHGVGVFVTDPVVSSSGSGPPAPGLSASILDILELRVAIEVESAGLAASRRSWAQEGKIWATAEAFAAAVAAGAPTETVDLAFHRSIAEATNNAAFMEFFDLIGLRLLPRRALSGGKEAALITRSYLEKSVDEHRSICEAISARDASAACEAMRNHLGKSQARYRGLVHAGRKTAGA